MILRRLLLLACLGASSLFADTVVDRLCPGTVSGNELKCLEAADTGLDSEARALSFEKEIELRRLSLEIARQRHAVDLKIEAERPMSIPPWKFRRHEANVRLLELRMIEAEYLSLLEYNYMDFNVELSRLETSGGASGAALRAYLESVWTTKCALRSLRVDLNNQERLLLETERESMTELAKNGVITKIDFFTFKQSIKNLELFAPAHQASAAQCEGITFDTSALRAQLHARRVVR